MYYEEVFRMLTRKKVRYVVAGGIDVFIEEPMSFSTISKSARRIRVANLIIGEPEKSQPLGKKKRRAQK